MPLQIIRGNTAEVNAYTPAPGELVFNTQSSTLSIGNGQLQGGILVGLNSDNAKDAAAASLLAGTHQNISFSYNNITKALSANVDIQTHGTIEADAVDTAAIKDGSTVVLDVANARLNAAVFGNVTGNVTGNINGIVTGTAGSSLIGNVTGNINGIVTGTAGSSLIGNVTGNINGIVTGTAGSSLIGNVTGNLTGTATGNIFTNLIDSADSSAITVTPSTIFQSDVFVQNDLNVSTIVLNGIVHKDIGKTLLVTGQTGESNDHFLTFVDSFSEYSIAKGDGNFRYNPSSQNLFVGGVISGLLSAPTINTANILTADIRSNGVLALRSTLADGTASQFLVSVGDALGNGRFRTVSSVSWGNFALAEFNQHHATVDASNVQFNRSRGTFTIPTAVQNGDDLADLAFAGYDGVAYRVKASISAIVDGSISTNVVPTKLTFATSGTTAAPTTAMEINSNQQTLFSGAVKLAVYADNTARDAAITAPTAGMMIFNTTGTKFQGYTGAAWVDLN